jgi:hypothetical protein
MNKGECSTTLIMVCVIDAMWTNTGWATTAVKGANSGIQAEAADPKLYEGER